MNIKQDIVDTLKKILGFYEEKPVEEITEQVTEETTEQSFEAVEEPMVETPEAEEVVEQFNKVYSESEIKVSQMEVGGKVELINADGELSDAPDGDYELENGKKFQVKDCLITSIEGEAAPEEQPESVEEPMEEEVEEVSVEEPTQEQAPVAVSPEEVQKLWDKIGELEQTIANMNQAAGDMADSFKLQYNEFTKQMEQMYQDKFQAIAKIPVEFSKTNNNNQVKESKEDKLLELAYLLGKK